MEVFDMGCGTGLVGEVMEPVGFTNIMGCDASQGILDEAAKKNGGKAYTKLIKLFLGLGVDKYPEDLKKRFDIITASGILAQGHLDTTVFEEMLASAKGPGSFIIFTTREVYLTEFKYQEKIDELVTAGKWKKADELTFHRYDNLGEEEVGRYKKVTVKCLAYEVL